MRPQYAIAWRAGDGTRFVGRLVISPSDLQLDGTSTGPDREHRRLRIERDDIRRTSLERLGEGAAVRIQTAEDFHTVEMLAGGRGMARELLEGLGR
jgi:hypothetical protein